jgi:hypothetical protein
MSNFIYEQISEFPLDHQLKQYSIEQIQFEEIIHSPNYIIHPYSRVSYDKSSYFDVIEYCSSFEPELLETLLLIINKSPENLKYYQKSLNAAMFDNAERDELENVKLIIENGSDI